MSRLQQLITELCPNGVEYKRLDEVADITMGTRKVIQYLLTHQQVLSFTKERLILVI